MKKFVILMITFLILFVFLMLNYLLWDKENLQKQSVLDKATQDYFRGKNNELQIIVNEQEQSTNSLKQDNLAYQHQITDLERQLRQANTIKESIEKQIDVKSEAIDEYKLHTDAILKALTQQWFDAISNQSYEDSYLLLDPQYLIFGGHFDEEAYLDYIAAVASIGFIEQDEEQQKSDPNFEILKGRGDDYEIIAIVTVNVSITEEHKEEFQDMVDGMNRFQIGFRYNPENDKWAIMSVVEAKD